MSNITDITPGTKVRVLTDAGEPFVAQGSILTVIDPDAWEAETGFDSQGQTWPSDAIAVEATVSHLFGPMALYEGDYEVVA